MEVGEWLRGLGLGQYEAMFRDNAIGMDVLTDLTENDLSQFGVLFGDRKRILKPSPVCTHPPRLRRSRAAGDATCPAASRATESCSAILWARPHLSGRLDPEDLYHN